MHGVVVLQNMTLHLPEPEFKYIMRRAAKSPVVGIQPAGELLLIVAHPAVTA